jgi:hypothetical protein
MRAIILASLALATSPALAVDFPFHADHLVPGERIVTDVHATGGGPQTGAHDLRVLRHVADNDWERLLVGLVDTPPFNSINANYLIYNRPFYAMASGTVVGCWRNAPENSSPPSKHPEVSTGAGTGHILLAGNHIWIKQADGNIALYAHAVPGSIPASLCPHNAQLLTNKAVYGGPTPLEPEAVVNGGATVVAGQQLGNIGNSGNSTEPHLHVHMVDASNSWQPMKFDRGQTKSFVGNIASLYGTWTSLKGNALPMARILIWPPYPVGNWTYNGIANADFQSFFDHFVDSGMMADTISCHNDGATFDTTWVPAKGSWIAEAGLSFTDYVAKNATMIAEGFKQTAFFTCGSHTAAIWRK